MILGQLGQGVSGFFPSGGRGRISNWRTLCGPLADGRAHAVGAGVAAADDDYVFAFGIDNGGQSPFVRSTSGPFRQMGTVPFFSTASPAMRRFCWGR